MLSATIGLAAETVQQRQPSSILVTTISDAAGAAGTLRDAIATANADAAQGVDTFITFAASLAGQTITLTQGELSITGEVAITGLGASQLTISGDNLSRIFDIDANDGGASPVTITGLTLTAGNGTGTNASHYGGAIFNDESLTLANDVITGNSATFGGGILNLGTIIGTDNTISGNTAENVGGGIDNYGTLTSTGNTISGNKANPYGGGINNYGTVTSLSDTISNNTALQSGGGIANEATLTATNDTISGNSAVAGGGGVYNFATLTATDDTITGNSVTTGYGGGIYNGDTLNAANTILAGNTAAYSPDLGGFAPAASQNNLIGLGTDTLAQVLATDPSGDPLLGDNGGPTPTIALVAGSPAIGQGGALTTLSAQLPIGNSFATVNSVAFLAVGDSLLIDNEIMTITGINGDILLLARAGGGSALSTHASGAEVFLAYDQRDASRAAAADIGAYEFGATLVSITDGNGDYNGVAFVASATVNGAASLEGVSPTVSYYSGTSATGSSLTGAPTTVGTYTVLASFAGSTDYGSGTTSTTFTISQSEPSITVSDGGGTFNGAAFPATDSVAGVGGQSTPAASLEGVTPTLAYYSGTSATGTALGSVPTAVGTYTVLASFAGSTDYTSGASSATFTIIPIGPVLSLGGAGPLYVPATEAPVAIAPAATLTAGDGAFANAKLVVTDVFGGANDRLSVQSSGSLTVNGDTLRYNGTAIGSFSGGAATTPLTITFNGSATQAAVLAVAQNVVYYNVVTKPGSTANRVIDFQWTDALGNVGAVVAQTVVYASPPALGVGGAGSQYVPATKVAVVIAPSATLTTGNGEFASATLTVTDTGGGVNDRLGVQSGGPLTVNGGTLRYNGTAVGSFSGGTATTPLTITFNGSATQAAVLAVAQHVVYFNVVTAPGSTANRVIDFQLTDGLGNAGSIVAQTVVYANAPVLAVGGSGPQYIPATRVPVAVTPSATLTVGDGAFANAKLVVTNTNGGGNDRLSVQSIGLLTVSGGTLRYNGTAVGSFSGGTGTTPLTIKFNAAATQAAVLAVVQNVVYNNVITNPGITANRVIDFRLTDGLGSIGATVAQTVVFA